MRTMILITLALALAGCRDSFVKPEPFPESVAAECRMACDDAIPAWKPEDPTSPEAWDTYPEQVTIPLRGKVRQCDVQRQACVQALDRLKAAGVTK